jgi:hypothetical protein
VKVTAGEFFLVEADHFACGNSFFSESFCLFCAAVDPNDLVRASKSSHFFNPRENVLVSCHDYFLLYSIKIYFF